MPLRAIFDSIQAAAVPQDVDIYELYRRDVMVPEAPGLEPRLRLSVLDVQPAQYSRVLLLLHGYAANSSWWRPQLPALAQQFRVVVIDARGNGLSAHPQTGYTIAQQVEDAANVLRLLQVTEPVIVAGHSAGGFVATDLALAHPEHVSQLILVATPFSFAGSSTIRSANLLFSLPDFVFRFCQPIYELDPRGQASILGLKYLFKDSLMNWDGRDRFPHITQPTLILEGHRDALFSQASYKQVAAAIPDAALVEIGMSKHQVTLERPKAVLRAMQQFIDPETGFRPAWRRENDEIASVRLLTSRPWIARYGADIPADLVLPAVPLFKLLGYAARQYGKQPAVRYCPASGDVQHLSYQQLQAETNRFSRVLQEKGMSHGDRILLLLPNSPHFVIAFFAAAQIGAIAVPLDPAAPAEQLAQQVNRTTPSLLITSEDLREIARQLPTVVDSIVVSVHDYDRRKLKERRQAKEQGAVSPEEARSHWVHLRETVADTPLPSPVAATDTAVILFTSGAEQRAVPLSHANLMAAALQSSAWMHDLPHGQCAIMTGIPFSTAYGFMLGLCAAVSKAAEMIIPTDFEAVALLRLVKQTQPNLFLGQPHQYLALNHAGNIRQYMPKTPPLFICSGAPLPVEVEESFERLMRAQVFELYGLTETGYATHMSPQQRDRTGSVGLPVPNTDMKIVDLATGERLPFGQVGELWVRGPQVMGGYWGAAPEPTEPDNAGWFHTGDLAEMDDDGYFRILGRLGDLIQRAETTVYLRDIEETIYELPEVEETAVVTVAGQIIAYVVPGAENALSASDVTAICRLRLTPDHEIDKVRIVSELPRAHSGKLLRSALATP